MLMTISPYRVKRFVDDRRNWLKASGLGVAGAVLVKPFDVIGNQFNSISILKPSRGWVRI